MFECLAVSNLLKGQIKYFSRKNEVWVITLSALSLQCKFISLKNLRISIMWLTHFYFLHCVNEIIVPSHDSIPYPQTIFAAVNRCIVGSAVWRPSPPQQPNLRAADNIKAGGKCRNKLTSNKLSSFQSAHSAQPVAVRTDDTMEAGEGKR